MPLASNVCVIDLQIVATPFGKRARHLAVFQGGCCHTWFFCCNDELTPGMIPHTFFKGILTSVTANSSFIFVKGAENVTFLSTYLRQDLINLKDLRFTENVDELSNCPFNACWNMAQWLCNSRRGVAVLNQI